MRLKKTAGCLLAIGMAVQIVTGIIWILLNFPSQWSYPESEYYISVAGSWMMDEYTGVLYPALIRVCQIITGCFGLPFEGLIYVIQLTIALLCYSAFLLMCRREEKRDRRSLLQALFGGLYLLTVPLCVQWHLSVLPHSLLSALFLLLLGLCIRAFREKEYCNVKFVIRVCALWIIMTLLHPDYWWLTLVPLLFVAYKILRAKCIKFFGIFLAVCIVAGTSAMWVNTAVQTPGSSGKIQRSLGASMVSRIVWPNFDTNYFFWPEEIQEIMTPVQGLVISSQADLVQTMFGPMVEKAYGRQAAEKYYWQMALSCIRVRTKEVLLSVGNDFTAYLVAPWQVKAQLDGSGLSFSGWHYDKMKTETPKLTRWYVDYGLISFRIGIVVAALLWICTRPWKGSKASKGSRLFFWFPVAAALAQVVWYTMAAGGMMDYRNVPVVILLWYGVIWRQYRNVSIEEMPAELMKGGPDEG